MVTSVYTLNVNADGSQHTNFPAGDKGDALVRPDSLTASNETETTIDLSWNYNSSGHTGFELQQWIQNASTSWDTVANLGVDARFYQATGLPSPSHVGHRIRAVGGGVVSEWSTEVWADTIGQPGTGDEWSGLSPNVFASASASGGGSGSAGSPWTLAEAMSNAVAGDTVGVYAGVYTGVQRTTDVTTRYKPGFEPANSGSANSRIVFVAQYPAVSNSSNRTELRSGGTSYPDGCPSFGGLGLSYVDFIGFYCNNLSANSGMSNDSGQATFWNSTNCRVMQCVLVGDPSPSHGGGDNYSAVRFEGCGDMYVSDCEMSDWATDGQGSAIKMYGAERCIVEHCNIDGAEYAFNPKGWNTGYGRQLWGNTFRYNRINNCRHGMTFAQSVNEGPSGERNSFHNNLITNCGGFWTQSIHNVPAEYEWGFGCDVYNNTVRGSGSYALPGILYMNTDWRDGTTSPADNNFYNNIIDSAHAWASIAWVTQGGVAMATNYAVFNYNCYHGTPLAGDTWSGGGDLQDYPWSSWQTSDDQNSHFDDPLFGSDSKLQPGSPCLTGGNTGGPQGCYITGNETIGVRG